MDTTDVARLLYRMAESFMEMAYASKASTSGSDYVAPMEACSQVMLDASRSIDLGAVDDPEGYSAPTQLTTDQNDS